MQLTTQDALRVVLKLGIEMVPCKHHHRGFFVVDGRRLFPVHFSHGKKEFPPPVVHKFRKSLFLTLEEFAELVGCTLSKSDYLAVLRVKGIVT